MTGPTAFEQKFGFRRNEVTLANWRTGPFSRWAFQNVGELVPSARIVAGPAHDETPPQDFGPLLGEKIAVAAAPETVGSFLKRSDADALVVMKGGRIVGDWFAPHMEFGARHIVFSISKSLTAVIAGILEGGGLLDPEAPVAQYIPEAAGSAYGDAKVRHVLDMTVSLDFEEAYLDPESAFARYRKATLWNPGGGEQSLAAFLLTLQKLGEPHGETFRYRSPNSDLLGMLVERASGKRFADLMREKLWLPLAAISEGSITVDMEGSPRTAGGISVTPRDLARVGEMMRQGGVANGRRIVPETWVRDTSASGGDARAWRRGEMATLFPEGRYRNKWYQDGRGAFYGIGIHGQWLYVDPAREAVIVKMSSQPLPVDDPLDRENIAFLRALAAMI